MIELMVEFWNRIGGGCKESDMGLNVECTKCGKAVGEDS